MNKSLNYWAVSDIIIEQTFTILDKQSLQPREEITMNSEELKELGLVQHIFVDLTAENGVKASCLILSADEVPRGTIQLSKRAKDKLGDCLTTGLTITKPEYDTVLRGIPKVDEIAKPYVKACPALVRKYTNQVELINPKNGFRVNLTLREDSTAKPNTLYFNRYIMLLLETHSEGHDPLIITRARTRSQPKPGIHKLINQLIQRPLSALGNFFIGKRELTLRVGHPYPFDEHQNLCRIHPNVRKLLGMEETDQIVISYNSKQITIPILDIDTEHIAQSVKLHADNEQLKFIDSHLFIGITALSRNELEIPSIGTSVTVKRSMYSLFLKHLNKLVLPVIALLFTIVQLYKDLNWSIALTVIISLVLLPIIIYTTLSEERAKIN
ncbi:hypothetical protein NSQ55_01275 [Paenibacillus sp. FSL H7-0943]|uniref:hypothetical protein n=1 Tax=Paenibacillus sp. FSL H7-0943 TaxID=2954739 RepID=UPI0030CE54B8